MLDAPWLPGVALVAGGGLAAIGLRAWLARRVASWRASARVRRAQRGERLAEGLLAGRGFAVVARQVESTLAYVVDGRPEPVTVRADLLVSRGGSLFVAEVKTGARAPRPELPATRRQLLEYAHAFEADGLLLVDADQRLVRVVEVPRRAPRPTAAPWLAAVAGLAAGFALAVWLLG